MIPTALWPHRVVRRTTNKNGYYVRHKYRARNGFGGMNIENKIFYLDKDGNVTGYTDYWKRYSAQRGSLRHGSLWQNSYINNSFLRGILSNTIFNINNYEKLFYTITSIRRIFSCAFFSFNLSATTISTKTNNKILVVQSSSSSKGNIIGIWRDDYDTKILHRIRKDKIRVTSWNWTMRTSRVNGWIIHL